MPTPPGSSSGSSSPHPSGGGPRLPPSLRSSAHHPSSSSHHSSHHSHSHHTPPTNPGPPSGGSGGSGGGRGGPPFPEPSDGWDSEVDRERERNNRDDPRVVYIQREHDEKIDAAKPDKFNGADRSKLRGFLIDCEAYFLANVRKYATHRSRILFTATYLTGEPKNWFGGYIEELLDGGEVEEFLTSWPLFKRELTMTFGIVNEAEQAEARLVRHSMRDSDHVSKYKTKFDEYGKLLDWNAAALASQFYRGLAPRIKDILSARPGGRPQDLTQLAAIALSIDDNYWLREDEKKFE